MDWSYTGNQPLARVATCLEPLRAWGPYPAMLRWIPCRKNDYWSA